MDESSELRVVYALPPPVSARLRIRQVLLAFIHVQFSEPQPAVFVLNRAGVPRRLFSVSDRRLVQKKARSVAAELESLGLPAFCGRYGVPRSFLEATEMPRSRLPQLHPLL
jgi:hypothetical protein